jgi:type IV pilus assembly protein PilY1
MTKLTNFDRRHAALALAALLCVAAAPGASAQDSCEIPLFVKQNLVGANVMFLADNSGSMNEAIYHLDYDPNIDYTGPFYTNSTYFVSRDGNREPNDFSWSLPSSPTAYLVNSDNGQDGRYIGNYLNWIYFHATDAQRAAIPTVTRIQVLKTVIMSVINRSARLKIGLTVFQYDHGGSIIGKCGVNYQSLLSQVAGLTANTWTPLGEAMEDILDYFAYDGPDAAIEVACQYNFCIVVTDGLPTMDLDVSSYLRDTDGDGREPGSCASIGAPYPESNDCSDYFDDVTYYMAHEDLRPDLEGDQNVSTYVVGFHENGRLLHEAAENGDGLFFLAENAVELIMSIEYAIQDILRRISAGSAVAVVSTERGVDDRLYRGKFMPIDWDGYLESYALPYEDGDEAIWEAGEILQRTLPSTRNIITAVGANELAFTAANASQLRDAMGVATDEEAEDLIYWARGNPTEGLRNRQGWYLGDIVHSTPVVVGAPANYQVSPTYQSFYENNRERRKMVYVGANDGMLHAFDAQSGDERWAFVPEFALPKFTTMADSGYCHTYTCDQTASVKDVLVGGTWRTVLVTNGREGGADLFALDITDPDNPDFMWQTTVPNGVSYLSEVEVAQVAGRAVAMVGSGLDVDDGEAWLYVYDLEDGNLIGGRELSDINARNKATRPTTVDRNLDGNADLVYIADMAGDVWRFDTNGTYNPASWSASKLFSGSDEITANPVAAYGENGEVWVYFGTGAYVQDDDMVSSEQQMFYGVADRHDGDTLDYRDLADQTDSLDPLDASDRGWYVELWGGLGERVIEQAVVVAGNVIFTSFAPSLDACVAGGESWLYQMAYDSGGNPKSEEDSEDDARQTSLGEGVASYPVVDLTQGKVVVQSSDASIKVEDIAAPITRMTVRSWQENWDGVVEAPPAQ